MRWPRFCCELEIDAQKEYILNWNHGIEPNTCFLAFLTESLFRGIWKTPTTPTNQPITRHLFQFFLQNRSQVLVYCHVGFESNAPIHDDPMQTVSHQYGGHASRESQWKILGVKKPLVWGEKMQRQTYTSLNVRHANKGICRCVNKYIHGIWIYVDVCVSVSTSVHISGPLPLLPLVSAVLCFPPATRAVFLHAFCHT